MDLDPNDAGTYFHLASLYDRMNRFPKVEESLLRAIQLKPDDHMALNYLAYSYADKNIHLDQAEKLATEAVALDPENGSYLDSMGWVYYRLGKFDKAEIFLKQALEKSNDTLIWEHLGDVQSAKGSVMTALLSWDKALQVKPSQKKLKKKIKRALGRLSPAERFTYFINRTKSRYQSLKSIKGLVRIQVCQGKPCFESRASMSYDQGGDLRVEVPGPLSGPVMLLVKEQGKPAQFGAIHPLFLSNQKDVTQAFERMSSLFSALLLTTDPSDLEKTLTVQKGDLFASSNGTTLGVNGGTGELHQVTFSDKGDVLRLRSYDKSKVPLIPALLEWENPQTGLVLRCELLNPVFSFDDARRHEEKK